MTFIRTVLPFIVIIGVVLFNIVLNAFHVADIWTPFGFLVWLIKTLGNFLYVLGGWAGHLASFVSWLFSELLDRLWPAVQKTWIQLIDIGSATLNLAYRFYEGSRDAIIAAATWAGKYSWFFYIAGGLVALVLIVAFVYWRYGVRIHDRFRAWIPAANEQGEDPGSNRMPSLPRRISRQ
jgi:hypothetical protein